MARRNGWKVEIKKPRMCFTRFSYERYPAFRYVKDGKRAYHWEATGLSESEAKRYEEAARRDGYSVRALPPALLRSSGYRREFMSRNPGPWRCRYCGRALRRDEDMEVDHLVPVAAAQKSPVARQILASIGAEGVNDASNLVPSCHACNARKGSKTGLWLIRGVLGAHRSYWVVLRIAQAPSRSLPLARFRGRVCSRSLHSAFLLSGVFRALRDLDRKNPGQSTLPCWQRYRCARIFALSDSGMLIVAGGCWRAERGEWAAAICRGPRAVSSDPTKAAAGKEPSKWLYPQLRDRGFCTRS